MAPIFSAVAFIVAMLFPLTRRITPTERARIVIRHAHLAGSGLPVTRADVLAGLDAEARNHQPAVLVDPEPVTPDPEPDQGRITPPTPGQADDVAVSLTDAATRLGVSISTIRRYCAPSSGRLARSGSGVTRASLEAVAATR